MKLRSIAVLLLGCSTPALAQSEHNIPTKPYSVDESYLTGLKWRNIGPNRGGRSNIISARPAVDYGRPQTAG
jgi:hypothetical protein